MAMRLLTKKEFESYLTDKLDLKKTDMATDTTRIWRTKSGKCMSIPDLPRGQRYPDYMLDQVICKI